MQFLSVSGTDANFKKPANISTWDSSLIFNKYLNIGSNGEQNANTDFEKSHVNILRAQEPKFGTASILTNSSLSASHPIDLPLQASALESSKSAASKAIVALQDKIEIIEKEN